LKPLVCLFLDGVFCSFRKNDKVTMMDRCFTCAHYQRFIREMEEEDQRVMDQIDRIREERGER